MTRSIPGTILAVTLLAVASADAGTDPATKKGGATISVLGASGAPRVVAADGTEQTLVADTVLPPGATVTTDATSRAALAFNRTSTPDRADVLLLGPDSEVKLVSAPVPDAKLEATQASFTAPLVAELVRGTWRGIVRSPDQQSTFAVRSGDHLVVLRDADAAARFDGAKGVADYVVRRGTLVIAAGSRTVQVAAGMQRKIEANRIWGATRLDGGGWKELVELTKVPGVEVRPPVLATKPPPKKPAVPDTPSGIRVEPVLTATAPASGGENAAPSAADDLVFARITTSMGDIYLELDRGRAPITVENFLSYADSGFYAGTIFHRVIGNFMIQGGGFTPDMEQKPTGDPIKNEWENGLSNRRGTIAMARFGGKPDSATSQFYINVQDNAVLDRGRDGAGYAVFGKVALGMDVVDAIKVVPTSPRGQYGDVPREAIVIEKVERVDRAELE